ncbi:SPOR domain-containing protein [Aureibaculum sp. A20]|uniref:SPOR domain-containing protein n=1 Tax=Aureibaculum flavum TaxID=2795986 RepID=A0ABS0WQ01_9FLAO|nr:SPOR domain-containing protein [Aureibaculum flavum]MBJ2174039.1 SPOR domain-containing protein [Aureibaculum flavum]
MANYIAALDQVPYEHALNFIKFEVGQWYDIIKQSDLTLESIGKFSLDNNDTIIFETQTEINYLTESFGMSSFVLPEVKRETLLKETPPIVARPVQLDAKRKKESNAFLKYAAIFVIGLSLLGLGANSIYQKNLSEQQNIANQEQLRETQTKIEKATFIVSEALPSLSVEVSLDKKPYHIIAGAFRYPENAQRLVNQLISNGYKARVLGANKWGLTQVSYESYSEINDAINSLYRIRETEANAAAWLLTQDL